jgi:hypothetical protein
MHLRVFLKLKKNPENSLFWANIFKKNPKKQKKTKKNKKNPLGWVIKKKTGFLPTLLTASQRTTI